jgi:hypothetical protein
MFLPGAKNRHYFIPSTILSEKIIFDRLKATFNNVNAVQKKMHRIISLLKPIML